MHMRISLGKKYQLKLAILISWTKFIHPLARKRYFWSKTEKVNATIKFCTFWTKFTKKLYYQSKMEIVKTSIELCLFELVLYTKFQLKLTILVFWTNFTQKGYFWSKTEKLNITLNFACLNWSGY